MKMTLHVIWFSNQRFYKKKLVSNSMLIYMVT